MDSKNPPGQYPGEEHFYSPFSRIEGQVTSYQEKLQEKYHKPPNQKQKAERIIEPIKIFYCYASQDRKLRDDLEKQLMSLKRLGQITLRLNREILAGTNWSHVEDRRFQSADLILLLISPDFISSDYHYGVEMHNALEKHEAGNVWVIPLILRPTALWERTPIGKLKALPKDGKAITERRNREAALAEVVKEISEVVASLLIQKQEPVFAAKVSKGKFPNFTRVIGPSCITCGARNPLRTITCENCGDLLLLDNIEVSQKSRSDFIMPDLTDELASQKTKEEWVMKGDSYQDCNQYAQAIAAYT